MKLKIIPVVTRHNKNHRLLFNFESGWKIAETSEVPEGFIPYNLHAVSDSDTDPIEKGDWYILQFMTFEGMVDTVVTNKEVFDESYDKVTKQEILISTDENLGVPEFDEEFLKEFCKQRGILEIEAEEE